MKTNKIAIWMYVTASIIFVSGFIIGIVMGNTYQVYDEYQIDKVFNAALLFYVWIPSFVSGMLFIGLGKIIDLLDDIKFKKNI
jgi:ABC-type dipeptide/oligopeptide/nickel transport system permease component